MHRSPNPHIAFGHGPHFCLGQQFAMVEMALVAGALLRDYDLAPDAGAPLPEPRVDLVLKPEQPIAVRFTRRNGAVASPRPAAGTSAAA